MNRTNALLASIQAVSPELHVQGAAGAAGAAAAATGAAGAPVAGAWAIAHVAIDSTIAIMHHIDLSIVDLAFLCHTETPTTDIALHGPPAKLSVMTRKNIAPALVASHVSITKPGPKW
jgi:hypothetical protein